MKWNKFLATLAMLIVSATAFAEREQSFFMELFGASTSLGIHYDSRFSDYTRWGGRIGIATPILVHRISLSRLQRELAGGVSP